MSARDLLRAGDPRGALADLKQEVRAAPRDARLRIFLFQLLCVLGDWDRATTQLGVAAELDGLALPMAQTYRAVIRCEMLREKVFEGARTPTILGEPEPWMSLLIESNRRLASGAEAEAETLRDAAFDQAPVSSGTLDGEAFAWIADADSRLGPMLEAIVDGTYYWVPFRRVRSVMIDPPQDLRDQVWLPAQFVWTNGGEKHGFIPTRYPGSFGTDDPALALSRRTEWRDIGGGSIGLGQRMLATDSGEAALMDVRRLMLDPPASEA